MEEERRLCYVGITRAKKRVYLVHAFRRSLMGSSMVNRPSRFLSDIPQHLLSDGGWWQREEAQISISSWNKPFVPLVTVSGLKPGDSVHHAQFGDGMVVSCKEVGDDTEAVVVFKAAGMKRLLLSFAQLDKVE